MVLGWIGGLVFGAFRGLWNRLGPVADAVCGGEDRCVCGIQTFRVSICEAHGDVPEVRTEMDSHADTCVLGRNALITHDFERPVHVTGYDKADGSKTYKTVSGVVGYKHPITGKNYYLHVHQAIYMPQLKHNLLCPMQLRLNDVEIDEVPKFLAEDPTERTHAISIPIDNDDSLVIPLSLDGVTSYFPTFKPAAEEFESANEGDDLFELTYAEPEWDPHDADYARQEDAMIDPDGQVRERPVRRPHRICPITSTEEQPDDDFVAALKSNRRITTIRSSPGLQTSERGRNRDADDGKRYFVHQVGAMTTAAAQKLNPATLARRWGIGIKTAMETIKRTTQRGMRSVLHASLSRRFRTNDRQLRYRRLPIELYTDTMLTKTKSRRGNLYAQVFYARNGWKRAFPMRKKAEAHEALSLLFARDGVPASIILDGSKEQTQGDFRKKCRQADCRIKQLEPKTPQANAAEVGIKELKNGVGRQMFTSKAPKRLWDDCLEFESYIQSNTWNGRLENNGEVPETVISGETGDISHLAQLGWYEWCMFRDTAVPFPEDKMSLGRYLGPSIDVGPAMTAKILKANGEVLHRSTYRELTPLEWVDGDLKKQMEDFDRKVHDRYGPAMTEKDLVDEDIETPTYDLYEDDSGERHEHCKDADVTPEEGDEYVNAQVLFQKGDGFVTGKVIGRKRDADGSLKGTANANPILDTRKYEVEFPDGEVSEYSANVIAENMWAQCDLEGRQHLLMEEIIDHRRDDTAVAFADRFVEVNGKQHLRKSTKGWFLCVRWKDGTTSWEKLADLKESYPIEVAEYAVSTGIDHEVAFTWWVPHVLKKRNRIIAACNKRYLKRTHRFGIRVPKTLREAIEIDRENGNTLWQDAIKKEMSIVRRAFRVLGDDEEIPPAYQEINCHFVFDVKMENFRRKCRLVAGGHTTEAPATITYASVVSRETVRIALTIAALNDLEVKIGDVENAYITAPCAEKIWTVLGPEFGADAGKKAIIVRSLYGLKSAGASYRNLMADCMRTMGYEPCQADPDLWRVSVRKMGSSIIPTYSFTSTIASRFTTMLLES